MADYQRSDIRVSDTEREDALGKLGQHMSEGRLDIEEYGERTAKVTAAKTRGELLDLFDDLPDPRPTFGRPAPSPSRPVTAGQRIAPVLIPVVGVAAAIALVAVLKVPIFLILPFMIFFFVHSGRSRHHGRGGGGR